MARERIEQEAVPVSEVWKDALQRADRVLKQWPRGARVAASIGLILAMTGSQARTGEGVAEASVLSPAEGKETTLELSAAQIPPAPEYIERVPVQAEEVFQKESSPEEKVATKANYFYEVKGGDSLSSIGQKFEIEWNQIAEENNILPPDFIIHAGEVLTIPLTGIFVPATENFVPSESILLRMAEEANLGINFLNNEILPLYGLDELALPVIDPGKDIYLIPYVREGKEAPAASAGEKISLYVLDIGELGWIGEELAIDHSRQDPIHRRREIWKIIHEDVHQVQRRFEYAGEFYEKDKDLTEALENITEYITFIGTTPYRQKEIDWGSADEDTLPGAAWRVRQVVAWIKNLNNHGLDGEALVLEYGLKGDMRGFEKLYDSYVGNGAFRLAILPTS